MLNFSVTRAKIWPYWVKQTNRFYKLKIFSFFLKSKVVKSLKVHVISTVSIKVLKHRKQNFSEQSNTHDKILKFSNYSVSQTYIQLIKSISCMYVLNDLIWCICVVQRLIFHHLVWDSSFTLDYRGSCFDRAFPKRQFLDHVNAVPHPSM